MCGDFWISLFEVGAHHDRFRPGLACVAGAWKKWTKERTNAREGDTGGVSRVSFSCMGVRV